MYLETYIVHATQCINRHIWLKLSVWVDKVPSKSHRPSNKSLNRAGGVAAHTFNPSTQEAEAGAALEFEASLVDRVSSRATQRNPFSISK